MLLGFHAGFPVSELHLEDRIGLSRERKLSQKRKSQMPQLCCMLAVGLREMICLYSNGKKRAEPAGLAQGTAAGVAA